MSKLLVATSSHLIFANYYYKSLKTREKERLKFVVSSEDASLLHDLKCEAKYKSSSFTLKCLDVKSKVQQVFQESRTNLSKNVNKMM